MKELWLKEHEKLVEEAMELDPDLTWEQAYTLTAASVDARLVDRLSAMADELKDRAKYEGKAK